MDHRGYTYHYDYENRLVDIRKTNDTITVAEFEYDALGRRIEMVAYNNSVNPVASVTTRYYYDDQRVLLETDYNAGTQVETDKRYFVYGNYIDEVLVIFKVLSPIVEFRYYYAHDHLYSPVAMFTLGGTVYERYEYDAYGDVTIWDRTFSSTRTASICQNPYFFTGRRLDSLDPDGSGGYQLKLMYYRARTYDPETGRFMQRDPLEYVDGMNLFEYVSSRPIILKDPYGLFYTTTECPDSTFGTTCMTKAGEPTDKESGYMECDRTERFLIALLGLELSVEKPVIGAAVSVFYATCCKCEVKYTWTEVPVREWKGKIMMDHGFFGIGENRIVAVDFQGLGPIVRQAVNIKRKFYINCEGKRIPFGSEDWGFMTPESGDFTEWPTESFNVEVFENPFSIWF